MCLLAWLADESLLSFKGHMTQDAAISESLVFVTFELNSSEPCLIYKDYLSSKISIIKTRLSYTYVYIGEETFLTHCGLVTPYSDIDLGQHWLRYGLLPEGTKPLPEPILTYH